MKYWVLRLCLTFASFFFSAHAFGQFAKKDWPIHMDVPSIDYTDLSGQPWSALELKGKIVVLNFWATWCAPCLEEMPSLQAFQNSNRSNNAVVLTINNKDTPRKIENFKNTNQFNLPIIADRHGDIAKKWGIKIFPTTVLVSGNGKPLWIIEGAADWTSHEILELLRTIPN